MKKLFFLILIAFAITCYCCTKQQQSNVFDLVLNSNAPDLNAVAQHKADSARIDAFLQIQMQELQRNIDPILKPSKKREIRKALNQWANNYMLKNKDTSKDVSGVKFLHEYQAKEVELREKSLGKDLSKISIWQKQLQEKRIEYSQFKSGFFKDPKTFIKKYFPLMKKAN